MQSPLADEPFHISNEHLAIALDQMAVGFWEVSLAEGNYMSCTDQCKRNFGRDPGEPFGYEDMQACIVPEDQGPMRAAVAQALKERQPYFAQYRVKLPNGNIRWIQAQGLILYDNELPQKIIGTTLDITKMKDLETLRDELLSMAMHELKTPLSAVKGSLQLIERHLAKHQEEQILAIATRALGSTDRITRLLNDMAQPMVAQTQEIRLQKTEFDLLALIREIVANADLLHKEHQINIVTDSQTYLVIADRFRIGQVITNLLNNAVKYSPDKPAITISIASDTDVIVKVIDQGLGIPPDERAKVFQKFYRSGQRKSIDGLGIGLYLCSEIIIRHGGVIGIEEQPGPGTTVFFSLPR